MKRIKEIIVQEVESMWLSGTCTEDEACSLAIKRLAEYHTQVAVLMTLVWPNVAAVKKDLFKMFEGDHSE